MHPTFEINKKAWNSILFSLQTTFIQIASRRDFNDAKIESLTAEYSSLIGSNTFILLKAASDISTYTHSYGITPTHGVYDEFKNIYFIGMAITEVLNTKAKFELSELHQLAMLRLLDLRLLTPYKANRDQLTDRIKVAIKNKTIKDHLGSYGWYLTYKCLYNAAHEANGGKKQISQSTL